MKYRWGILRTALSVPSPHSLRSLAGFPLQSLSQIQSRWGGSTKTAIMNSGLDASTNKIQLLVLIGSQGNIEQIPTSVGNLSRTTE